MTTPLAEAFAAFTRNGGGKGPAELLTRRKAAFERFTALGFPSPKDEEWRFTPVAPIARREWRTAPAVSLGADALAPFRIGPDNWTTLVFVNGRFDAALSTDGPLPEGVTVSTLADDLERNPALLSLTEATPFAKLNSAFATDGAVLRVAADVHVANPIHILYVAAPETDGQAQQTRTLVAVERGARLQVVESFVGVGSGTSFTNAVTTVRVGENAWVEQSRIQREQESAFHIGLTEVEQARDSHYRSFSLAMGGAIARHDLRTRLGDRNVETLLYGLYLGHGEQLVDNHTVIYHDHPHCRSWEVYKGILDGRSRGVFNGKVMVSKEAQQTDAKQTNRNLLLSDHAKVDTKPQLEIFADDVKCTHGATVGRLDEAASFYIQSRGIPREEAQRLLIYAFAAEVIAEVESAPVREVLDRLITERLRRS